MAGVAIRVPHGIVLMHRLRPREARMRRRRSPNGTEFLPGLDSSFGLKSGSPLMAPRQIPSSWVSQ